MAYVLMLPKSLLLLRQEVLEHHKDLFEQVCNMEYEEGLGTIAAHVNVVLDDFYTEEDIEKLHYLLLDRLQAKRTIIVH